MSDRRGIAALWRMTEEEYRANLDGLNMFFGAVLGIVLSGTDGLDPWRFGLLLLISASYVVTILYISSSPHRLAYAAMAVVMIALLPGFIERLIGRDAVPPHLQPTLTVWVGMVIVVEFARRRQTKGQSQPLP